MTLHDCRDEFQLWNNDDTNGKEYDNDDNRDHICHKQYKQRLCKIIITRVKVHFVDVF